MDRRSCRKLAIFLSASLIALLSSCGSARRDAVEAAAAAQLAAASLVAPPVASVHAGAAEVLVPSLLAFQDVVQEALPPQRAARAKGAESVAPAAVDLIVRWEVTSAAVYTRRYQGIVCPGGASGPTGGIGYDFGQQTRANIGNDWRQHPDVAQLQTASGVVGDAACRAWRARHRDIRITYALAERVFRDSVLPAYYAAARRALRNGWDGLSTNARGANTSLGYNRGWSMRGQRNTEKRAIRDDCVPAADHSCNAAQLVAMCRLWANSSLGRGLCARRRDEARLVLL